MLALLLFRYALWATYLSPLGLSLLSLLKGLIVYWHESDWKCAGHAASTLEWITHSLCFWGASLRAYKLPKNGTRVGHLLISSEQDLKIKSKCKDRLLIRDQRNKGKKSITTWRKWKKNSLKKTFLMPDKDQTKGLSLFFGNGSAQATFAEPQ